MNDTYQVVYLHDVFWCYGMVCLRVMYDNNERYDMYMYARLIEKLCHENNGSIMYIVTMYHDLKIQDLMLVVSCNISLECFA